MWRQSAILVLVLAGSGFISGCSDGESGVLTGPTGGLTADDMAELALRSDALTEEILSIELDTLGASSTVARGEGSGTIVQDVTFSRSRSCPAGGEFLVEGSIHRTFDPDTRVMEAESSGTRTRTDCAFVRGEMTVTINGSSQWDIFRRRVDGRPDGAQTSHYAGSWSAVRSDGEERFCEYDFTVVREPGARTRTLEGTMCGNLVRRHVSWDLLE